MRVAAKKKSNDEVRIGTMTRARTKLLQQQVNSLLNEYDVCVNENFILPKSMHLCMIRFINNTSVGGGDELPQGEGQSLISNISKCAREEREAGAQGQ